MNTGNILNNFENNFVANIKQGIHIPNAIHDMDIKSIVHDCDMISILLLFI